jgi:hypothetical protein
LYRGVAVKMNLHCAVFLANCVGVMAMLGGLMGYRNGWRAIPSVSDV